ncbi:DUF4280 domain-containing protein [Brevibacillus formosus]
MMQEGPRYVVRGAKMRCNCGSHQRRINLPVSHGSYVNEKPMMNIEDYKPVENIAHFGICQSPTNQNNSIIYLIAEDGQNISGKPCTPTIYAPWIKVKDDTKVAGKAALTTDSLLICGYDGVIRFFSDGQHDE